MTEPAPTRVAVYLDFDNIVISRYDQVNGRNSFQKDKAKGLEADKLTKATVDVGAILDFASSFGTLVLTRAYADWSADVNAGYRQQLVGRAVDLVQLFPAAAHAAHQEGRKRGTGAARSAGHRDGAAPARSADRLGEGRRRVAAQLGGQGADEADGPVVLGEVSGVPVVQRLPALTVRLCRVGRELHDPHGAVASRQVVSRVVHKADPAAARWRSRSRRHRSRTAAPAFRHGRGHRTSTRRWAHTRRVRPRWDSAAAR